MRKSGKFAGTPRYYEVAQVVMWAEWQAGQTLRAVERDAGGRPSKNLSQPATGSYALDRIDTAHRLNPHDPAIWTFLGGRAFALFFLDRLDEAADWARRSAQCVTTGLWAHGIEAAVLGHLGREQEAAAALAEAYRLKPDFSIDFVRQVLPYRIPKHRQRFLEGLARAGLDV